MTEGRQKTSVICVYRKKRLGRVPPSLSRERESKDLDIWITSLLQCESTDQVVAGREQELELEIVIRGHHGFDSQTSPRGRNKNGKENAVTHRKPTQSGKSTVIAPSCRCLEGPRKTRETHLGATVMSFQFVTDECDVILIRWSDGIYHPMQATIKMSLL